MKERKYILMHLHILELIIPEHCTDFVFSMSLYSIANSTVELLQVMMKLVPYRAVGVHIVCTH